MAREATEIVAQEAITEINPGSAVTLPADS